MKEQYYFLHLGLHVLPDLLTFSLVFFIFASKYFSRVNTDPNSNVMLSVNDSTSTCYVEIGAQQHNPNWTDRLRQSLMRNIKTYRVDMCLNIHSAVSLNTLGSILDILSQPKLYSNINSNSRKSTPALELDITVPKYPGIEQDMQCVVQRTSVNLEDVAPLIQKLTLRGPFADFLFIRPPYRTISDMIFDFPEGERGYNFSSLKELRLLDCTVDPRLLANILAQCPVLTILEVQTVGSALNESSSENAEDLACACPDDTSSNLDLVHHFHLRHLKLTSVVPLAPFFSNLNFINLETLSIDLAPSAINFRPEVDIARLSIPWNMLTEFELRAPMEYCNIYFLKRFLCLEPSNWRRKHVLLDNRSL